MSLSGESLLLTDLYQLTMLQGYVDRNMDETAVFEFFVRDMPNCRNFFVAAGLEQVMDFLQHACFTPSELEWLSSTGHFHSNFIDFLASIRFTGDLHAMPEGSLFFPNEPILRITAPLTQAQLYESRIINILHLQTLLASKAVRMRLAAPEKLLVDFGLRRAHGAEAGLLAARACYIAGFNGTATVQAGERFGIPIFGTMAHSFIQAHSSEVEAFRHFAHSLPKNVVLLIDTYDTERGAARVVELAPELATEGIQIKGVRLDSGDLLAHAHNVRRILDQGGLTNTSIFASGNLDEYGLETLLEGAAPIDGFGIGTRMDTSADAPYLDCAYKLQEYAGIARRKRSEGKATWPGRKQVYRYYTNDHKLERDSLTLETDTQTGEALIQPFMREGKRLIANIKLADIQKQLLAALQQLPDSYRSLRKAPAFPVEVSRELRRLAKSVDQHTLG